MQESQFILILSTAGTADEAGKIAEKLVQDRLVACVNILPGIQSIYRWKDEVQKEQEVLMIMKTTQQRFDEVQRAIRSMHSYEVPEIISFPLEHGSHDYLKWIENTVRS